MRGQMIAKACAAVLFSFGLAACGGGGSGFSLTASGASSSGSSSSSSSSSSGSSSSGSSSSGSSSGVETVTLIVSPAQIPSAATASTAGSTVTAIVKDANNNLVQNANVNFSASAGALAPVSSGSTGTSGYATALLTTAGDPANQAIVVTASVNGATDSINVSETGTSVSITGATVVGSGASTNFTVTVADSSGTGLANETVQLTSSLGNSISPASATTNGSGQAVFSYTGKTGGTDTLTASASETINNTLKSLNATQTASVNVTSANLVFQSPQAGINVPFNTSSTVSVVYTLNGTPQQGATVLFSSTRGSLSSSSAVTGSNGVATVSIESNGSDGAGGTSISAQISGGPSATDSIQFISTTPSTISIQASPTTIAPAGSSALTVVVRDAQNNLVYGQPVYFTLSDITGGSISPSSGVTDQTGTLKATYQATSQTSANNGVQISSSISGTSITTSAPALITVGGVALNFSLGTSNQIQDHTPTPPATVATSYDLPWTVIVTDSAGNPAPSSTVVNASIVSTAYQKGTYTKPATGSTTYGLSYAVTNLNDSANDTNGFGCKNEDTNNSGVYSVAEDWNHNGKLDPGAVASVPTILTLDSTGLAAFNVTYPKNFANWVQVTLTVTASVAGTESTTSQTFFLPVAIADIDQYPVSPPGGLTSPFGVQSLCSNPN